MDAWGLREGDRQPNPLQTQPFLNFNRKRASASSSLNEGKMSSDETGMSSADGRRVPPWPPELRHLSKSHQDLRSRGEDLT